MTRGRVYGVEFFDVLGRPTPRRSKRGWWIAAYLTLPTIMLAAAAALISGATP